MPSNKPTNYIEPNRTFKCRIGLHAWGPVRNLGCSICYRCNLLDAHGIKYVARVKKNGSVA